MSHANSLLSRSVLAGLALAGLVQAQTLTTLWASNNGGSAGGIVYFDLTVTNKAGLRITALDVNCNTQTTATVSVDVYTTPTTYKGVEVNAAAWTKVASGIGVRKAQNTPAYVNISDFILAPGTYGIGVVASTGQRYTNGTGSNQAYSNADLALALGAAMNVPFSGSPFTPRIWNGTVYYVPLGGAGFFALGAGCTGTNGVPAMAPAAASLPKLNTSFQVDFANLPAAPGSFLVLLGLSDQTFATLPLPLDLGFLGLTGCNLFTDVFMAFTGVNTGGKGIFVLPIPNDPFLVGAAFYLQGLIPDAAANPGGLTFSNYGEGIIGN